MRDFSRVHLVGIGGDGMAGLARLLWQGGVKVSGSDLQPSGKFWEAAEWAEVFCGHAPENIPFGVDAVVFSSAVSHENPELRAVQDPLPRLYALRQLLGNRLLLAVVGTHGKTTTATWLTHLLRQGGLEPGHYVGGQIPGLPSATWGQGKFFVAEVDESDGRFVYLSPYLAVLTSVDTDHLPTYRSLYGLKKAFHAFLCRAKYVVAPADDPGLVEILRGLPRVVTFGFSSDADFQAKGLWFSGDRAAFELWVFRRRFGPVEIPAPGPHNVRNALAALAAGHILGLSLPFLAEALSSAPRP